VPPTGLDLHSNHSRREIFTVQPGSSCVFEYSTISEDFHMGIPISGREHPTPASENRFVETAGLFSPYSACPIAWHEGLSIAAARFVLLCSCAISETGETSHSGHESRRICRDMQSPRTLCTAHWLGHPKG
jgi:hypothetical protein